jgi:hypothetical protein
MNEGITINEACANNVIGTKEDFERLCNKDGTVKSQPKTTTFTLKNDSTKSITVVDTHLQIGLAIFFLLAAVIIGLIARKLTSTKGRK